METVAVRVEVEERVRGWRGFSCGNCGCEGRGGGEGERVAGIQLWKHGRGDTAPMSCALPCPALLCPALFSYSAPRPGTFYAVCVACVCLWVCVCVCVLAYITHTQTHHACLNPWCVCVCASTSLFKPIVYVVPCVCCFHGVPPGPQDSLEALVGQLSLG